MRNRARCALAALVVGVYVFAPWRTPEAQAERVRGAGHAPICIFDHMTLRTPAHTCRPRARSYPASVKGKAERAIYDSSLIFGIPYSVLLAIGRCESALNPHASNGTHFGLFQFDPGTFISAASLLHRDTGIVARSYWNALDSSYAAGYLFATGHSPAWTCETSQRSA